MKQNWDYNTRIDVNNKNKINLYWDEIRKFLLNLLNLKFNQINIIYRGYQ